MANTGFKGVDVRQTGSQIVVRVSLKDSTGAKVTTGSASLYLYELQSDGTLKSYDFTDNTFKTTVLTTETAALTHRSGNNGGTTTGLWTYALATLTGFTAGAVYVAVISHTGASPAQQEREFQYGSEEGDYVIGSIPAVAAGANGGLPLGNAAGRVDVGNWLGSAPNALQGGRVDSYLGAVAAGVIAAASFASGALDAVWSTTTRTLSTGAIVAGTFAANALDAVWSVAARTLTAGTNIVLAKGIGVTGFNDLSAAAVNAEADTALADVGVTGTVTGRIDAAISSRSSHTAADVAAQVTTDHGAGSYARNTEPPTSAVIAAQVRIELTTELARVDAAISSRLAAGTYTAPDNASITAIKTKTDNLPSDPADASDIATATNFLASGVVAIKAKTDLIPANPAATGDIPSAVAIASAVRTELATELARIDVALSTLSTYDGSDSAGVTTLLARLSDARATLLDNLSNLDAAISALTFTLSSAERQAMADAYLDRVDGIEPGMTPREGYRLMTAAALGLASGMDTDPPAPRFRDTNDTKDRIAAVCDEFGNRLSVTLDAS